MYLPILFIEESLIPIFSLELWVNLLVFTFSCEVKVFVLRLFIRNHWPLYRRKTGRIMEWPCPSVCLSVRLPVGRSVRQSTIACWLVVFYVTSTARSFRDGTPIYCPLRRTWSSVNTPYPP